MATSLKITEMSHFNENHVRDRLGHSVTHSDQSFARGPTIIMPNVHLDGQSFHHSGIVVPTRSPHFGVESSSHHGSNTNTDLVIARAISTVVGESSNHVRPNSENHDLLAPCGSRSPRTPAVSLSINPITRNRSIQQTLRTVFPTILPEVGNPDVSYVCSISFNTVVSLLVILLPNFDVLPIRVILIV